MSVISRRSFMQRSLVQGGVAGALVLSPTVRGLFFTEAGAQAGDDTTTNTLITVFLRGGIDFLNLVVPMGGDDRGHYEAARTATSVPVEELVPLAGSPFGLHPASAPLGEIFEDGKLAIVQGAGHTADTRSHFASQELMNYGAGDETSGRTGWLARMLGSKIPGDPLLPAVALGNSAPRSFNGSNQVVAVSGLSGYGFPNRFRNWQNAQRTTLRRIHESGSTASHAAGLRALAGSNALELFGGAEYSPANGVEYPANGFGRGLQSIAQLIKSDVGLRAATLDVGGWDTHSSQGFGGGGFFGQRVGQLTEGLAAFHADLADRNQHGERTTVVVMSEFGRRVQENGSQGTDHGHGGGMLVLGGSVNGGLYGEFPGLARDALYDGADLAVTTDYRRVLSDIIIRQFGDNHLGKLFPGYTDHAPLGLVAGTDLEPDYTAVDDDIAVANTADDATDGEQATANEGDDTTEVAAAPAGEQAVVEIGNGNGSTRPALIGGAVGLTVGVAGAAGLGAMIKRRRAVDEAAGEIL